MFAKPPGIIQQLVASESHIVIATDQGLYGCGDNNFCQLGQLSRFAHIRRTDVFMAIAKPPDTIQQVMAGYHHIIVLTDQGLYACGNNQYGQLGLGHNNNRITFIPFSVKNVPIKLQQRLALYHQLDKLITFEVKASDHQPNTPKF